MTDKQKLEHLISKIQERANYKHCIDECGDDYNPGECKNYDDAFEDGSGYGEVEFARELLRYIVDKPKA
jgi:hypothetical protein